MISKQQLAFRLLELSNTFVTLYELKDIALAAKRLNLSSQELAAQLQELEKKLALRLFVNPGKYSLLTRDGQDYYDRVVMPIDSIRQIKKPLSQND